MAADRAQEILELCEAWRAAAIQPDGAIVVGPDTAKRGLLVNGIVPHELARDELEAALVGLARMLALPRRNVTIGPDHLFFWAWSAGIIRHDATGWPKEPGSLLIRALELCMHPLLAIPREPERIMAVQELLGIHAVMLLTSGLELLGHTAFPLLELVAKLLCPEHVTIDGEVLQTFSVEKRNGARRPYKPGGPKISSLRDLLFLVDQRHPQVSADLARMVDLLPALEAERHGFDAIFLWRNSTLHGAVPATTAGAVVLTIGLRLGLELVDDFERAAHKVRQLAQASPNLRGRFYPPL